MTPQQELITHKAIQLFGRYGVKTVSMNDVAAAAGLSRTAVDHLFENKDELIQTVVAQLATSYAQSYNLVRRQCATAPEEVPASVGIVARAFRQVSHRLVSELHADHYHTWQKIDSFRDALLLDLIRSNLVRGQEQGYYRRFDPDAMAARRLHSLNALHDSYEAGTGSQPLHQLLTGVAFQYLAGIVTPEGAQLLKEKYPNNYPPRAEHTTQ